MSFSSSGSSHCEYLSLDQNDSLIPQHIKYNTFRSCRGICWKEYCLVYITFTSTKIQNRKLVSQFNTNECDKEDTILPGKGNKAMMKIR